MSVNESLSVSRYSQYVGEWIFICQYSRYLTICRWVYSIFICRWIPHNLSKRVSLSVGVCFTVCMWVIHNLLLCQSVSYKNIYNFWPLAFSPQIIRNNICDWQLSLLKGHFAHCNYPNSWNDVYMQPISRSLRILTSQSEPGFSL